LLHAKSASETCSGPRFQDAQSHAVALVAQCCSCRARPWRLLRQRSALQGSAFSALRKGLAVTCHRIVGHTFGRGSVANPTLLVARGHVLLQEFKGVSDLRGTIACVDARLLLFSENDHFRRGRELLGNSRLRYRLLVLGRDALLCCLAESLRCRRQVARRIQGKKWARVDIREPLNSHVPNLTRRRQQDVCSYLK
jgi:hypothetical protein